MKPGSRSSVAVVVRFMPRSEVFVVMASCCCLPEVGDAVLFCADGVEDEVNGVDAVLGLEWRVLCLDGLRNKSGTVKAEREQGATHKERMALGSNAS
jgi:hypothetical protein